MDTVLVANEDELRRFYLFNPCKTQQQLHDWIVAFLGIDFPDSIVDEESNCSPMELIWKIYSKALEPPNEEEGSYRVMAYAARSSYKTLAAATIEVLSLLHLGRDVAHMAAIEGQAKKAQSYVKESFRRPYIREFVVGDNERMLRLQRYYNPTTKHSVTAAEFRDMPEEAQRNHEPITHTRDYDEENRYVAIVICSLSGANSEHTPILVIDEVDVISNPVAFQEAKSIPSGRNGMIPITLMTSTRKSAGGLVQKEIDNATKSGLRIFHWNVIDVTKACPPKRHQPTLPRLTVYRSKELLRHVSEAQYDSMNSKQKESYVKDVDVFAGCGSCKLYPMCRGNLATKQKSESPLLLPIPVTIDAFSDKSLDYAKAQLLCWRPSMSGKIYSRFDKLRHVLLPAQAYEKIWGEPPPESMGGKGMTKVQLTAAVRDRGLPWGAGMDFGDTHDFAMVGGFKDGSRAFVMRCVGGAQLDPQQQLEVCEPLEPLDPDVYPDPSNPQMIRMFKKRFRMRKWKKNAGSVVGGISVVQAMLSPILVSEPNLYFVVDPDGDPEMDLLIERIVDYEWKTGPDGRPMGIPNKVDDDQCDALRYWLMNTFGSSSGLNVPREAEEATGLAASVAPQQQDYGHDVVAAHIAAVTGRPYEPTPKRVFRIEAPEGSGHKSYYDDDPGPQGVTAKKGKKGNLTWDLA